MLRAKAKIKFPIAILQYETGKIMLKNISRHDFLQVYYDLESHFTNALKRFSNASEESNYYALSEVFDMMRRKLAIPKTYYSLSLSIPQARCLVKLFSMNSISSNTLEINALLDQKLPKLC